MAKVLDNIKKLPSQLGHQFQKLHKPVKDNEKRVNQRKELFQYKQCAQLGFPAKPSAITFDSSLKLLAIGTKEGALHVFGSLGVEYSAEHTPKNVEVRKVLFIPNQGRLLTLTSDWVLHHWEINGNVLEEVRSLPLCNAVDNTSHGAAADAATGEDGVVQSSPEEQDSQAVGFSGWTLTSNGERLFVGSESGSLHIITVNHESLQLEEVLTSDQITNLAPLEQRSLLRLGAIVQIAQSPKQADRILLGFERGTALIYNSAEKRIEAILSSTQSLTDVTWFRDGERVKSSHQDGSYVVWAVSPSEIHQHDLTAKPSEPATTPYGPFPCKAITKLFWKTAKLGNMVIFGGGMPRASYGDKYTVSVIREDDHVCFDFTSKVVDLELVCSSDGTSEEESAYDEPHTLFVLCEEELVAIDLYTPSWPLFQLPYLQTLHSSSITALCHVAEANASLVSSLRDVSGNRSSQSLWSKRDWPVTGGRIVKSEMPDENKESVAVTAESEEASKVGTAAAAPSSDAVSSSIKDLIVTGHEDGSVVFWLFESGCISRLCTLKTNSILGGQPEPDNQQIDDDWPPFRKTGQFDPFVDDPRIAVTLIKLVNETLLVGGAAGQISVWNLDSTAKEIEVDVLKITADLLEKDSEYVWKGHSPIPLREGSVQFDAGWQPTCVVQVLPAAAVSAIAIAPQWQLLAVGTSHGLAIIDTRDKRLVNTHFTVPTSQTATDGEHSDSRGKQIRKSLRQSFRKLRKLGGAGSSESSAEKRDRKATLEREKKTTLEREKKAEVEVATDDKPKEEGKSTEENLPNEEAGAAAAPENEAAKEEVASDEAIAAPDDAKKEDCGQEAAVTAPTEEEKETATGTIAEPCELDSHSGVVRCLRFANACLTGVSGGATLWAGTNAGIAYGFHLTVGAADSSEQRRAELSKEVRLVHRAPVLDLFILARGGAAPCLSFDEIGHELLLVSEEQVKVFALPSLKPRHKNKVSAVDGGRIRSAGLARFTSSLDATYSEYDLLLANSLGQVVVISLPRLVRQTKEFFGAHCVAASNDNNLVEMSHIKLAGGFSAFRPFGLTTLGHSQLRLFALGTRDDHQHPLACTVDLADGMRPVAVAVEAEVSAPSEPQEKVEAAATEETATTTAANEQPNESNLATTEDVKMAEESANVSINQTQLLPVNDGEKHQGDITMDNITEYITSAEKEAVEKQHVKCEEVEVHAVQVNDVSLVAEEKKGVDETSVSSPHDTELTLEAKYAKEADGDGSVTVSPTICVAEH